jgi:ATP-dependent Lon protease
MRKKPDWDADELEDDLLDDDDEESEDQFSEVLQKRTEELYNIPDAEPDDDGLIECPVLPLRDVVIYPHMVSPLFLGREVSLRAVEEAQKQELTLLALVQRDPDVDDPGPEDFLPIGVEMAVGRLMRMPDGSSSALVQARRRIHLIDFTQLEPYMIARGRPITEARKVSRHVMATMRTTLELFNRCVQLNRSVPEEAYLFALNIDEPGWLADMVSTAINPSLEERQELLMLTNPVERLERVNSLLAEEVDMLELEDEIQTRTQNEVDRTQREYYLREQMKIIQTELGDAAYVT